MAHKNQKNEKNGLPNNPLFFTVGHINGQNCFANISSYRWNQRLIFGVVGVLDLVNTINGLDLDCGSHINKKNAKNVLPVNPVFLTVGHNNGGALFCKYLTL